MLEQEWEPHADYQVWLSPNGKFVFKTDKGQQAQRARLFLRWFNGYQQQQKHLIKSAEVKGEGRKEIEASTPIPEALSTKNPCYFKTKSRNYSAEMFLYLPHNQYYVAGTIIFSITLSYSN